MAMGRQPDGTGSLNMLNTLPAPDAARLGIGGNPER